MRYSVRVVICSYIIGSRARVHLYIYCCPIKTNHIIFIHLEVRINKALGIYYAKKLFNYKDVVQEEYM